MKKILILVLLLGLININTLPCYAKTVKVRANTPVEFTVAEVKSSADTAVGEKVSITVDNDVVVNGVKVFKTGAKGYLLVNDVQKRAFWSVVVATLGLATVILFPLGLFGFVRGKDAKTLMNVPLEANILDEFYFTPAL